MDTNPTALVATALLVLLVPLSMMLFGLVAPEAAGQRAPTWPPRHRPTPGDRSGDDGPAPGLTRFPRTG